MQTKQAIRCPNCGSHAERHYHTLSQLTQTQCPACDYLLITCSRTGKVVETSATGIYARH
jgi:DNA-directed RNA polymerase subunit RPC12/RpoP